MGEFLVTTLCPHGTIQRAIGRNSLMWRAQGPLLRAIVPTASGAGSAVTALGFGGPAYQTRQSKPALWDLHEFLPGRRGRWADYVGGDSSEGAAIDDAMRSMFGYARKPVTLQLVDDDKGIHIDSGWKRWTNALTWDRHGDWTPVGYYDDPSHPAGSFRQPGRCWNCGPRDLDHGYPWCVPRVSHMTNMNWWANDGHVHRCRKDGSWYPLGTNQTNCEAAGGTWMEDENPPDNSNERSECYDTSADDWILGLSEAQCAAAGGEMRTVGGVACTYCSQLFYLDGVASVRIGVAFLTYEVEGADPLILAAAQLSAPIMWRPGGLVSVRYRGRFWIP